MLPGRRLPYSTARLWMSVVRHVHRSNDDMHHPICPCEWTSK